MKLETYIRSLTPDKRRAIKKRIEDHTDVTRGAVNHWCNGTKRPSPLHAIAIEKATDGFVNKHELRPDIFGGAPNEL